MIGSNKIQAYTNKHFYVSLVQSGDIYTVSTNSIGDNISNFDNSELAIRFYQGIIAIIQMKIDSEDRNN